MDQTLNIPKLKNKFFEYLFERILEWKIKFDYMPNNYVFFRNNDGINNWGQYFNDFFKLKKEQIGNLKSNKEEKYEIETYEYYSGRISELMNDILRGQSKILFPEQVEKRIEVLSQSLSKFRLKDNLVVIRRIPKNVFNHRLKKGDFFLDKGFLSTSVNLSYRLDNESNYRPINNEVLMVLKVPKETNACYIEQISNRGEYELLIQKENRIKVEKNIKILNNRIVIGEITN